MNMEKTYRSILKWGDKKERPLVPGVVSLVKQKFGFTDEDLQRQYLSGNREVHIAPPAIADSLKKQFEAISGAENVRSDDFSRAAHAYGKFYGELLLLREGKIVSSPDLVISPRNEEEIIRILALCQKNGIAITPVGGCSSVTKGVETPRGGISLDLTKNMNKILQISDINMSVRVQPGIYGPDLEKFLNRRGFTCGHFPQSFEYSTVGGWVAARGAGQASTGYGKIEDMVLALRVVTPAGTVETRDFPATAEAWDIKSVFIGSEGTLGVITSITLKMRRFMPENRRYASFVFKDFGSATEAMRQVMQSGSGFPFLFRLSDPEETATAFHIKGFDGSFSDRFLKVKGYHPGKRCLLLAGLEGDKGYTRLVKKKLKRISARQGAFYTGEKPVTEWLKQRYESAYLRDPLMDAGVMTDTVETAVTWENLLNLWTRVRHYLESREKTHVMAHISHVYENGASLYFTFLSPMAKENVLEDYLQYHRGLMDTIQASGGSLSHHHGIGRVLAPWLQKQWQPLSLGLLRTVKDYFDPKGIMNPGNLLDVKK